MGRGSLRRVGRVLGIMAILVIGAIALAVIGPTLPADNPLRNIGVSLRGVGQWISRGFGGGYGEIVGGN